MAVATVNLQEVEVILNNRTVQAPARVSFYQNGLHVRVNIHGEDGELAAVHEIEVGLVGKKVVVDRAVSFGNQASCAGPARIRRPIV